MKAQKAGCGRQMVQKEMCAASVKLCEGKVDSAFFRKQNFNSDLLVGYYAGFLMLTS